MPAALAEISRDDLWGLIESNDELVLVDALPVISYAAKHLPGAINIPPDTVVERAERWIPDLDAQVVVYCANPTCESSIEVAERLVELGYRNVRHFPGGKREWAEASLPFDGARV